MEMNYNIYLICYYNERPIDFLLPIYTCEQFANLKESSGTCFKIRDKANAEIVLACRKDEDFHFTRIDVESACLSNANISFSIIINEREKTALLRAFTDEQHNGLYPLPLEFIDQTGIFSATN